MFSLYRNPDIDYMTVDCLLAIKATVQVEDVRAFFLFVGELNGRHQDYESLQVTHNASPLTPINY